MNSVNLVGRITKDLELRYTETSHTAVVGMFIAINNGKDKEGNERPADFPKIYVYDKQAENLNKYCKKGSLISIEGRIKTRNWEKEDGTKGYETYVLANRIQFLESKSKEEIPLPEPDYSTQNMGNKTNSQILEQVMNEENNTEDPFKSFGEELGPDDLPF